MRNATTRAAGVDLLGSRRRWPLSSSWLLLGALLAGIFAMHGLGTHGTHSAHTADPRPLAGLSTQDPVTGADAGPATGMTTVADHAVAASHDVAGAASTLGPHLGASPGAPSAAALWPRAESNASNTLAGMSGLLGLCFAVLTALTALWVARVRGWPLLTLQSRALLFTPAQVQGRDPDPPSLTVLSVHRC